MRFALGVSICFFLFQTAFAAKENIKKDSGFTIQGGINDGFSNVTENVVVPGYISTRSQSPIATIIGPVKAVNVYLMADNVYLRWEGSPAPKVGDNYTLYSPALVLQHKYDTTDFRVIQDRGPKTEIDSNFRIAGFLYEPNGEVRISYVDKGLVRATVTQIHKKIGLGDHLMLSLPRYENIQPITGGLQLSAVIAAGSPPERLSPTLGAFVYINRGSRDGVKIGQVFQVIEKVPLVESPQIAPTESMGELKVVYTTDSFSTALITKQIHSMRLGALIITKQSDDGGLEVKSNLSENVTGIYTPKARPNVPKVPPLSELDELERRAQIMGLTSDERSRLNSLQTQDASKRTGGSTEGSDFGLSNPDPNAVPNLPDAPKLGGQQKQDPKKRPTAKKKRNGQDEADLNQLMQF